MASIKRVKYKYCYYYYENSGFLYPLPLANSKLGIF